MVERERPTEEMIERATRCRHHQMRAATQGIDLRTVADAAVDGDRSESGIGPQRLGVLPHLPRQLPCRHHHQRLAARLVRIEALEHRKEKRGGLATPGPGLDDDVAPRQ